MAEPELFDLFEACVACFPEDKWSSFRDPVARSGGEGAPRGPARRWFRVTDGQEPDEAFFDGYRLISAEESDALASEFEAYREESDFCWVQPQWTAIAEHPSGDWLMIDSDDGSVLEVFHDDSTHEVLAPSAQAWLRDLRREYESGQLNWDADCGLKNPQELEDELEEQAQGRHEARRQTLQTRHARRRNFDPRAFELEERPWRWVDLLHLVCWGLAVWQWWQIVAAR
ncbi:MAG: SMI1/KNR4 family protein [Polyangiaceae bacterium]